VGASRKSFGGGVKWDQGSLSSPTPHICSHGFVKRQIKYGKM
jgi:hypothetical protein